LLHGKSYTSVCRTRDNPFQKFSVPTRIPQYISCASPGKNRQDGYSGHFTHSFVHPAFKKSTHGVLPFTEEECILLMSIKPRENLLMPLALPHQNLTLYSLRNTFSADQCHIFNRPTPALLSLANKTGSSYNALQGSDSC
jgi:hypothetical protein